VLSSKYRIHAMLILVALVIIFLPQFNERPPKEKAAAARAAAAAFLQQVDQDTFAASWQSAAPLLKEKVTEAEWVDKLSKIRSIAGPMVTRSEDSISYSTTAQDSPDGEYILLTYDTTYKARGKASEIVTVMLDKDGAWRVAGYFVK